MTPGALFAFNYKIVNRRKLKRDKTVVIRAGIKKEQLCSLEHYKLIWKFGRERGTCRIQCISTKKKELMQYTIFYKKRQQSSIARLSPPKETLENIRLKFNFLPSF